MHVQRIAAGDPRLQSVARRQISRFQTQITSSRLRGPTKPSTKPGETVPKLYKFAWEPVGLPSEFIVRPAFLLGPLFFRPGPAQIYC